MTEHGSIGVTYLMQTPFLQADPGGHATEAHLSTKMQFPS